MRRPVEAELQLELLDELRVEPLRAAIARGGCVGAAARLRLPAGEIAGCAAGDARGGAGIGALQLRQDALHRPARRELHDDEGDEHDAEQRRDHEQQAAGDIGEHRASRCSIDLPLEGRSAAAQQPAGWGDTAGRGRRT